MTPDLQDGAEDVDRPPAAEPLATTGADAQTPFGLTSALDRTIVAKASLQMVQWQGHYPPPDAAERFEKLHPGAFARMLTMAERAQEGQIASVTSVNENIRRDAHRGAVLGTAVTLASMVGAGFCAFIGQPWVAAAFLGVPVLSVARSLIETSRKT